MSDNKENPHAYRTVTGRLACENCRARTGVRCLSMTGQQFDTSRQVHIDPSDPEKNPYVRVVDMVAGSVKNCEHASGVPYDPRNVDKDKTGYQVNISAELVDSSFRRDSIR